MWNMKEFRDDSLTQTVSNWMNAEEKLLEFLNEENHEVVSFSAYGQYGDKYKLIYKEREVRD